MRYAFLLFILCWTCSASAQLNGKYSFRHIDQKDGLLHTHVTGIHQDSKGFIWVLTTNGLQRYDGSRFVNYTDVINQTSYGIFHDSQLYIDTAMNYIWVTKSDRMERLDLSNNQMMTMQLKDFLESDTAIESTIFMRENGAGVMIGEYGVILYKQDGSMEASYFNINPAQNHRNSYVVKDPSTGDFFLYKYQHLFLADSRTKKIQSSSDDHVQHPLLLRMLNLNSEADYIRFVMQDHLHNLWIATWKDKFYRYDPVTKKLFNYSLKALKRKQGTDQGKLTTLINAIYEDRQKNLWFGTDHMGLLLYDRENDDFNAITSDEKISNGLRYNFSVTSIFQDRDDNIWLGTDRGISIFNPYKNYFQAVRHIEGSNATLPKHDINDIIETLNGEILIGTWGGGLSVYDTDWNFIRNIQFPGQIEHNLIWSFVGHDDGTIWAGTQAGYIHVYDPSNQSFATIRPEEMEHSTVISMKKDLEGNIFFGLHNGKIAFWDKGEAKFYAYDRTSPTASLFYQSVFNIFIDRSNQCWVATASGLQEYDNKNHVYKNVYRPEGIDPQLGIMVQGIEQYNDSLLLLGTVYNGVYFFNKISKKFSRPPLDNDLLRTSVYAIKMDRENNIWLTTNFSLIKINNDFSQQTRFDIDASMMNAAFGSTRFYELNDGRWVSSTLAEIICFDPQQIRVETDANLEMAISGFKVFDEDIYIDSFLVQQKPVILPYDLNFISIEFSALDYTDMRTTNYHYRLLGVDQNWNHTTSNEFAKYTDLKPGDYVFEVKGDKGGRSSPVISFPIIIRPPWWGSIWFRVLSLVALGGIFYFILKNRIQAIRKQSELKHRIAETEMMALRSQMNPHFIFNCINGIDAMIQSNDKYRATVYLNKFAKLIRNILDISKQNKVHLSKDIETLQLYIDLELFRHEGKFTASIHADDELIQNDYVVPPLIIQPYVENAILHGLRHRNGQEGKLNITVTKNDHHIVYIIEDNGVGRKQVNGDSYKNTTGYGMQIGNDRVRLFNNEEIASVDITDLESDGQPAGTRVQVQLKIQ